MDPISGPRHAATPAPAAPAKPLPCKAFSLDAPDAPAAATAPADRPAGPLSAPPSQAAKQLVARMLDDEAAVDRGLRAAMSGRKLSAQELLVLQAQVIQYSQEIDVASRVVDKATGAVRQVLQTQV